MQSSIRLSWQQARATLKGQFIVLASLLVAVALGQSALATAQLRQARQELVTVGRDSTPSIDAAQAMAQYLEEIDAKATDLIGTAGLREPRPCAVPGRTPDAGPRTPPDCAGQVIAVGSALFTNEWYKAVRNVTYPGERTALDRVAAGFQEYSAQIAVAQYELSQTSSASEPGDAHLRRAREAVARANTVLDTRISRAPQADPRGDPLVDEASVPDCMINGQAIPAATWAQGGLRQTIDCFSSINKGYLDAAYEQATRDLSASQILVALASAVLCATILLALWRMAAVTHRVINPGLALALLLGLAASATIVSCFAALSGPHGTLKVMVRDAYDSVYATNLLKRYSTAANADESRWLVAVQFADQGSADGWATDWQRNTTLVQTSIDQAIRNETFREEHEPLSHIQADWAAYTAIDPQIRALATSSAQADRIATAQRLSTGDSNTAFTRFISTVEQLRTVNAGYFTQTYQTSLSRLDFALLWSTWLIPLAGISAAWGIAMRLKEF